MNAASAELQYWFARLAELDAAAADAEIATLAQSDPALAARVRELLDADAAIADLPTEPLLPELRALRQADHAWEGRQIGRWRVIERIGSGGMGTVYRAACDTSGETAAIKLLRAELDDAPLRRRFALERRVLQSLRHAGIARLVDDGETPDGTPYVALEFIAGTHFLAYADQHRLDLRQRIDLLLDVCAAVTHAHGRQVVHRDIKSSNILVTAQGRPKLLDFGIAKPLHAQFGTHHLERTATAQRFFSASSAAPEQLSGETTGPACDIYALGALLYELLCGEAPLALRGLSAGQTELAILRQIPLSPSQRLAALPPGVANARARQRGLDDRLALLDQLRGELDRIALKALRKSPAQRHASVAQFAQALRAARDAGSDATLPQRIVAYCRARPRRLIAAGLCGAVLAAVALLPAKQDAPIANAPGSVETAAALPAEPAAAAPDPAARVELLLALAQSQAQRGEDARALATLADAEALLAEVAEPRVPRLQLLSLRAAAATRAGSFPLATQALDDADTLATTTSERAGVALQRVRLLAARGREAQAEALLRDTAQTILPRLRADDPLATQIRHQLDALGGNVPATTPAATSSATAVPPLAATRSLAGRIEALSRDLDAARAEAGIEAPASSAVAVSSLGSDAALPSSGSAAPVSAPRDAGAVPDTRSDAARQLAEEVARACDLNVRGDYAAAAALLERALERQRSEPALRHGDDYRVGVLAAAIARYGAAPSDDLAERLRHELARDAWLSGDEGRLRWREQAAVAQKLGVRRID